MFHSVTTRRGPLHFELTWDSTTGERQIEIRRLKDGQPENTKIDWSLAWDDLSTIDVRWSERERLYPAGPSGAWAGEIPADVLEELGQKDPGRRATTGAP